MERQVIKTIILGTSHADRTFNAPQTSQPILESTVTENAAVGGGAPPGGNAGLGVGGGVYFSSGPNVCVDELASIFLNTASTSDDDVFGPITT